MKMRETSRVWDKKLTDNNNLDSSVYEAMVNMTHDFSLTTPLVDGHGNFGSMEGDMYAAYRYCVTEDTMIITDKGVTPISFLKNLADGEIIKYTKVLSTFSFPCNTKSMSKPFCDIINLHI